MTWRRRLATLAVLFAVLGAALMPVTALGAVKKAPTKRPHISLPYIPSSLGISTSGTVVKGQQAQLNIHLATARGPVSRATVHVFINGAHAFGMKTNAFGNATYKFHRQMAPGSYTILVVYRGSHPKGAQPAQASATLTILPANATVLTISPLSSITTGQEAKVTVTLADASGNPLGHKAVHLSVNGQPKTVLDTAADGTATYRFSRATPAGAYALSADFKGIRPHGLLPSTAQTTLNIMPMSLTIQTLPAVLGAGVTVDGVAMKTDSNGKVVVPIGTIGNHSFTVAAPAPSPDAQVSFAHWSDGTTATQKTIHMFGSQTEFAVFSVKTFTHLNFVAADGSAISPASVRNLVISGPDGTSQNLDGQTDVWLALPVPPRDLTSAGAKHPRFTTKSAYVNGINVLNGGSNGFTPIAGASWNITLGLYTLDVNIQHVIPGRSLGGTVQVVEANGWTAEYQLGNDGRAKLRGLPRGNYTVTILKGGFASSTPIALSRSQPVNMKLIDRLDLVIICLIAILILLAVLARPIYRRTSLAARRAAARR
ncbi:MAG TPA: hypothetical protein VG266_09620 [Candidatus Dormibacteraeota bacterium]|nr:hypothetical protein [Candidatus Dormibacteraeota bacterium]